MESEGGGDVVQCSRQHTPCDQRKTVRNKSSPAIYCFYLLGSRVEAVRDISSSRSDICMLVWGHFVVLDMFCMYTSLMSLPLTSSFAMGSSSTESLVLLPSREQVFDSEIIVFVRDKSIGIVAHLMTWNIGGHYMVRHDICMSAFPFATTTMSALSLLQHGSFRHQSPMLSFVHVYYLSHGSCRLTLAHGGATTEKAMSMTMSTTHTLLAPMSTKFVNWRRVANAWAHLLPAVSQSLFL